MERMVVRIVIVQSVVNNEARVMQLYRANVIPYVEVMAKVIKSRFQDVTLYVPAELYSSIQMT